MPVNLKVTSFTDLKVWQTGHRVVLDIYQETKLFPKEEQYGLICQVRRAAVSITCNIAEGFSRSTAKDKMHFYAMALGSLTELQNQLLIAKDLGYISNEKFLFLLQQLTDMHKMTNGLFRSAASRP